QARESQGAERRIKEHAAELEAAEQAAAALAEQRSARLTVVSEQEGHLRALRDSLNDLRDSRGKEEVRQTQLQLRIENLVEHVMRRYQVDLRAFKRDTFAFQKTLTVVTKRRTKPEPTEEAAGPNGSPTTEDLEPTTQLSEN